MAMRVVTLQQFAQGVLRDLPKRLERAVAGGLRDAAQDLATVVRDEIRTAQPHPAVDTGALLNSVDVTMSPLMVVVSAPHASYIDKGTRPFWPPIAPLAAWAIRKGLASDDAQARSIAFGVARSIAQRGIAPRNFMAKSWARFTPLVRRRLASALAAEAARAGSRAGR